MSPPINECARLITCRRYSAYPRPSGRAGSISPQISNKASESWSALCSRFGLLCHPHLADFLEEAPELWRRCEPHGSIRIQEGEPPSFLIVARFKCSARPESRR